MKDVIIIEDEIIIAKDLKLILESAGFNVLRILDGKENVLDVIEKSDPDIILSDIYIRGEKNGIELMREQQKLKPKPLIFITAYSSAEILESISKVRHDGFIVKPFTDAQVIATTKLVASKYIKSDINKKLSDREKEVMQLLINGLNSTEIADHLFISHHTVKSHKKNIYQKLEITNIVDLMKKVILRN
jgi:DNA-binding NarL/FixJ family response regulator